ncbi:MAG: class I adenylate-forming enzyme family protein [Smithellaceae bacterium]
MLPEHKGYEGQLIVQYFIETMRQLPKRRAITCLTENREFSYGELDKITNQLNYKFRQANLAKDDVVMVCLLNTWQFPMFMLGAWKTPCIFSAVSFRGAPGEIAHQLEDSRPKVLAWDVAFDSLIKTALEISKYKPSILICTKQSTIPGAVIFEDYYKAAPSEDPDIEERIESILDPFSDEIIRMYTSGTTGRPKGTRETSAILLQMDIWIAMQMGVVWNDKVAMFTPWFHQGGIHFVTVPLSMGAHVFGMPMAPFNPDAFLDIIEKHKLTLVMGAPTVLDALASAQKNKKRDLSSLGRLFTMGAPFSREEYIQWRDHLSVNIGNAYGTTETSAVSILDSQIHDMGKYAGTAGRVTRWDRIRIIQVRAGERVEPNQEVPKDNKTPGEIIIKSSNGFLGYLNRPEDTAKHLYKGWFYTGDMATWDEDGFITIGGRTDDLIQSGGEKVYPIPVEEALLRHPKVQDAFVVPMPHPKWGQAVAAYVLPKKGETLTVQELEDHCLQDLHLANYTRPRFYQIVTEALPYTATGKKMHYVMTNRAKEEVDKFIPISSQKG